MSLISVLMPARNAAKTIEASLRSILQAGNGLEIIVVDDRSTDATQDVVARINDPRVKLIGGEGKGISRALNLAFDASGGDYICRCDADDLYPADRFAWQLPKLRDNAALAAVGGSFTTMTASGEPVVDLACEGPPRDVTEELLSGHPVTHLCTWLIRRSAWIDAGGAREWFETAEDVDLMLRLAATGRVWHEPRSCYFYRLHDSSIVHVQPSNRRVFFDEAAVAFAVQRQRTGSDALSEGNPPSPPSSLDQSAPVRSREQIIGQFVGAAWAAHARGDMPQAHLLLVRALKLYPFSLDLWKQLILLRVKRR